MSLSENLCTIAKLNSARLPITHCKVIGKRTLYLIVAGECWCIIYIDLKCWQGQKRVNYNLSFSSIVIIIYAVRKAFICI